MDQETLKVFIIGIDGGTFDILNPFIKKGYLPTIKELLEKGSFGTLTSTMLPLTAPAWASFMTGVNPGKHGIYDFMKKKENSYERVTANATYIKQDTLWKLVSDKGKKVIVINVPMTYPPEKVNGIMISGFLAPETDFYYPKEILDEITENVGEYTIHTRLTYRKGNEEDFLADLLRIVDMRKDTALYLMDTYPWDLFMVLFSSVDTICHWFYKHLDKTHPEYSPGDAIPTVYKKIDAAIKAFLERLDDDTAVLLVSDHGSGPVHKSLYVNNWLIEHGYISLKENIKSKFKYFLHRTGINLQNVYGLTSAIGIPGVGKNVSEETRTKLSKFFISFDDIDWKRTKAFSAGNFGQLFLNVKGREPEGCIPPSEYESVRNQLIEEFKQMKDPENGDIIENIYKREEIYTGPYVKDAPDILFVTKDFLYEPARYFEFGSNKLVGPPHRMKSGTHRMNGIFMAVHPECIKNAVLQDAHIVDAFSTILYMLGIEIPAHADGKVLKEIFRKDFLEKHPVRYSKSVKEKRDKEMVYSEEEEEAVKERLRNLGYFD